jgi:hypothetical protein
MDSMATAIALASAAKPAELMDAMAATARTAGTFLFPVVMDGLVDWVAGGLVTNDQRPLTNDQRPTSNNSEL